MTKFRVFVLGLAVTFGLPWLFLIVIPAVEIRDSYVPVKYAPPDKEKGVFPPVLAGQEKRGKMVYMNEGCAQCHSQMIRPANLGMDQFKRGWGADQKSQAPVATRQTAPWDYLGEDFAALGIRRNGPDLSNVGYRHDEAWHHAHLYNPRAVRPWSSMPSYRNLYLERPIRGQASEDALVLPPEFAPEVGYEIVPTAEADALVDYLMSLKKDYPLPVSLGGEAPVEASAAGGNPS